MTQQLTAYPVWDRTVRIFHWINVLCILGLIAIGVAILNSKALGVTDDGKLLLKTVHVYIGYVFAANLTWRIVWGFIGNRYSRWKSILPFNAEHRAQLTVMKEGAKTGKPVGFLGHSPIARLMVGFLFVLMSVQAITGLVLAGTDVYMLPFGNIVKESIAIDSTTVDIIKPYSKEGIDDAAYKDMRDVRKPFITVHYYAFWVLLAAILLHILGVVVSELRERNGLVSAMFNGKKVFADKPFDAE
ncbi:MAG: cytochrome b/b6 domain-containing protein [Pseudomonadota bacterium]|nr:cytochrome b/b6 domain-containing protein [Pseudomonadota bacterium]MDO7711230.1 cytochrome b/b6 domain-containing protein [Pseudomonadota bacterium]